MTSTQSSQGSLANSHDEFEAFIGSTTLWQSSQQVHIISFRPSVVQRSIELMQMSHPPRPDQANIRLNSADSGKPLPPTPKITSVSSFPKKLISAPSSFGSSIMKGARRLSIFRLWSKKNKKAERVQLEARIQIDRGTQTDPLRTKSTFRAGRRTESNNSHASVANSSTTFSSGESARHQVSQHRSVKRKRGRKSRSGWAAASAFPKECLEEKESPKTAKLSSDKKNKGTETPSVMLPAEWAYTGPPPWNEHTAKSAAATSSTLDTTGTYGSRYSDPIKAKGGSSGTSLRPTNFTRRGFSDSSVMLQPTTSESVSSALGIPRVFVDSGKQEMMNPHQTADSLNSSRTSINRVIHPFRKRGKPTRFIADNGSEFESPLRREVEADQVADPSVQTRPQNATISATPSPMPSSGDASLKYQIYFPAFTPAIETDVPEHFKGSPLCPLHPKHKSTIKICPYHGRLPTSEEMLLTPSSRTNSDKSRASDGSGIDPLDRRGFQLQVPEHSPNSPLCPANLKYNPNGRRVCVYHGRGLSLETRDSSEDSIPRKEAMMTFTSGSPVIQ